MLRIRNRKIHHLRRSLCLSSVYTYPIRNFCSVTKLQRRSAPYSAALNDESFIESIKQSHRSEQLTEYLTSVNLKKSGTKETKIERLIEHFHAHQHSLQELNDIALRSYCNLFNLSIEDTASKHELIAALNSFSGTEIAQNPENTEDIEIKIPTEEEDENIVIPIKSEDTEPMSFQMEEPTVRYDQSLIEIDEKQSFLHKHPIDVCSKVAYPNGSEILFETSRISHLTESAIIVNCKGTIILTTACSKLKSDLKFEDNLDLKVDAHERSWSRGYIPSGLQRSDGGITDYEILLCRMIDRSIRPLFIVDDAKLSNTIIPAYEVQILSNLLSCDDVYDTQVLAINGASAAVYLSPNIDIGDSGPIGAVRVIVDEYGEFIANPTKTQIEAPGTKCNLLYVGTADNCVMIETDAITIDDAEYAKLIQFAQENTRQIVESIKALKQKNESLSDTAAKGLFVDEEILGKYKGLSALKASFLSDEIVKEAEQKLYQLYSAQHLDKNERNTQRDALKKAMLNDLCKAFPDGYDVRDADTESSESMLTASEWKEFYKAIFYEIDRKQFRASYSNTKTRCDGRQLDELRGLQHMIDILPSCHGSSLFQRGNTQTLCSATIGPPRLARMRNLHKPNHPEMQQRLYFQYEMAPSATNEIKAIQSKNRRAIGHANIALNALKPLLPSFEQFPYSIRVFSNITASDGSSSMASVCGGSLALMDAGIPMSEPAAGISMGLIHDMLLTDIAGIEDHFGDMDFKIAGTRSGINSVQLDIKRGQGIPLDVILNAIQQSKQIRLQILDSMNQTIDRSKGDLKNHAPRVDIVNVPFRDIPRVIGSGGATKKKLEIETKCDIEIFWEKEQIEITAPNVMYLHKAKQAIMDVIGSQCRVGDIITAKIVNVQSYGVMIEIEDGTEHLVHISQWMDNVSDDLNTYESGQDVDVMCIGYLGENRPNFSRKAAVWQLSDDPEDRARLRLMLDSLRPPARSRAHPGSGPSASSSSPPKSATDDGYTASAMRSREPLSIFADLSDLGEPEEMEDAMSMQVDADVNEDKDDDEDEEDDDDDSTHPSILPPPRRPRRANAASSSGFGSGNVNDSLRDLVDSLTSKKEDKKPVHDSKASRFANIYKGISPELTESQSEKQTQRKEASKPASGSGSKFGNLLDSIDSRSSLKMDKNGSSASSSSFARLSSMVSSSSDSRQPRSKHSKKNGVKNHAKDKWNIDNWKKFTNELISNDGEIEKDEPGDNILTDLFGEQHKAPETEIETQTKAATANQDMDIEEEEENEGTVISARAAQILDSIPELMQSLNDEEKEKNKESTQKREEREEEQWPWQQEA